ncbi:hypothetical protein Pan216_54670 [Planctomycetes bacterium Pan216]|uniref:4-hydroxy-tetrahydrodipicolinate synthase n=1 Tax=Kolteria novifilia TaxID=2527975 RepID=A0A518BC96_9BACT|nr:hypothetical protein Pan216_54670 [Planctomycetes bacterium Pan216]
MNHATVLPSEMIKPKRKITGMSAILLPFDDQGRVDWDGFSAHLQRTLDAGLIPAINMDTGYINLLGDKTKIDVLDRAKELLGSRSFVAGVFVKDRKGDSFNLDATKRALVPILERGGLPTIFPCHGLKSLSEEGYIDAMAAIAREASQFLAFELGTMFAPFGRVLELDTYERLLEIPECVGAKHSSLSRRLEWDRIQLRDRKRPEFRVLTGNDLAIDMVMYGSDYLLGLSTFAPDLFAKRDRYWETGDPEFYELNDWLQYLGFFTFRAPVPAYKHNAAQFLKLRGWLGCDDTHPDSPTRPATDREVLATIAKHLNILASS